MLLVAPKGINSVSLGGKEYKVKKGTVDVPDDLGPQLLDHGLTIKTVEADDTTADNTTPNKTADGTDNPDGGTDGGK